MNADTLSTTMFWAGALMVFTPMVFAGTILAVWWYQRRRAEREPQGTGTPKPGHP